MFLQRHAMDINEGSRRKKTRPFLLSRVRSRNPFFVDLREAAFSSFLRASSLVDLPVRYCLSYFFFTRHKQQLFAQSLSFFLLLLPFFCFFLTVDNEIFERRGVEESCANDCESVEPATRLIQSLRYEVCWKASLKLSHKKRQTNNNTTEPRSDRDIERERNRERRENVEKREKKDRQTDTERKREREKENTSGWTESQERECRVVARLHQCFYSHQGEKMIYAKILEQLPPSHSLFLLLSSRTFLRCQTEKEKAQFEQHLICTRIQTDIRSL